MSWEIKRIKDVAIVTAGQSPEGIYYNIIGDGLPFFQGKKEFDEKFIGEPKIWTTKITKIAEEGDVLMSVRAPVGPVNFATQKCCIGRGLAAIRVTEKFNKDFLFLFFKYIENELTGNTGAVFNSINKSQIENLSIPLPTLSEQQQIVEKLDTAFDLIDRAKANIEKNIQNAKELFQSKLNQVFSEKGEGWEEVELAKVCTMKRGHNPPKSKFIYEPKEGYVRFYQIRDGSSEKNAVYVPDTPQLQRVEPDDILMVAYRHVGRAFRGVSGCFNVALCKISNNDQSILDNDFLFYLIPSDVIRGELLKHSERSLIPSMSVEHLKKLAIPLPPINEQKVIVELLNIFRDSTDGLIYKYQQKLNNLEELRKSILEKAFKGEL